MITATAPRMTAGMARYHRRVTDKTVKIRARSERMNARRLFMSKGRRFLVFSRFVFSFFTLFVAGG